MAYTNLTRLDLFIGGTGGYHSYRIPALIRTPKGVLVAFCEGRRNSEGDSGDIDILCRYSADEGKTWSSPKVVFGEPGEITIGNPCPIVDTNGKIHLLFTQNNERLFHCSSEDNGVNWSTPCESTQILTGFEYPAVRVATGPGHGISLPSGRLLAPVWLSNQKVDAIIRNPAVRSYRAGVLFSDDLGISWKPGGLVPDSIENLNECMATLCPDGDILLNLREHAGGSRIHSYSPDQGLTWTNPVRKECLPCPTCQASIIKDNKGNLIFLNPSLSSRRGYDPDKRRNLCLQLSANKGDSWRVVLTLNPGPSGYSDLAYDGTETLFTLFECGVQVYREKITFSALPWPVGAGSK